MSLLGKYQETLDHGSAIGVTYQDIKEEDGQLKVWGTAPYAWDKVRFWDKLKETDGWDSEVIADIGVADESCYGMYEIQRGDSLSKIAEHVYGESKAWRAIAKENEEEIPDPNKIHPGQVIRLPSPDTVS